MTDCLSASWADIFPFIVTQCTKQLAKRAEVDSLPLDSVCISRHEDEQSVRASKAG